MKRLTPKGTHRIKLVLSVLGWIVDFILEHLEKGQAELPAQVAAKEAAIKQIDDIHLEEMAEKERVHQERMSELDYELEDHHVSHIKAINLTDVFKKVKNLF